MRPHELDDPGSWTLTRILRRRADALGDAPALDFEDGTRLGFADLWQESGRLARLLREQGVVAGERVAVMLTNRAELCLAWVALAQLGAVHVAVDPAQRGEFLRHVLALSGARWLMIEADLLEAISPVLAAVPGIERLLLVGAGGRGRESARAIAFDRCLDVPPLAEPHPARPSDIACVMTTSGTTGPAKAVLMPHAHCTLFGLGTIGHADLGADDRYYVCLPLFHANGLLMQVYACLIAGASAFVRSRFSASAWLDEIRREACTHTNVLGATAAYVLAQLPSSADRDHGLRCVVAAPNAPELEQGFRQRFGIRRWIGVYGMTEVNIPLYTPELPKPGSCGRVWSRWFELRIADPDSDAECLRGEVGEIQVRPRAPHGFMAGYLDMPEATVEAWRGLWFHTGDAARMDADGDVFFVDRIKDCIRRRGENLSSLMIEQIVGECPGLAEVAAVAVPSRLAGGEDDLLLALVAGDASACPDERTLRDWCAQRLPRAAQPDHLLWLDALPKTPTGKVQKKAIREAWLAGR
jgi:carnitine-CoA ligase